MNEDVIIIGIVRPDGAVVCFAKTIDESLLHLYNERSFTDYEFIHYIPADVPFIMNGERLR